MRKSIICLIFIALIPIVPKIHAEIKILSTQWNPSVNGSWTKVSGLTYNNTVYGDTYYNPNWQDQSKNGNIDYLSATRYFYLKPNVKQNWSFSMTLTNLNAEKGYSYWSQSNPDKKQRADQIYWGILIGYKENGASRTAKVWIKRSNQTYDSYGYPDYYSDKYIEYNVDNSGWKKRYLDYPSCSPNYAPTFQIDTYSYGNTYIKWGGFSIIDFPSYMEELSYITIMVGTQAKIQIGKPSVSSTGVKVENIYMADEYMKQQNYAMVKQKLYRSDQTYYEGQAYNLAIAYAALLEFDQALELCNALIKYNGEVVSYAYGVRGIIREAEGHKIDALDDYFKAGDEENYNRLYNEIYRPKPVQQKKQTQQSKPQTTQQKKSTQTKTTKPPLTK